MPTITRRAEPSDRIRLVSSADGAQRRAGRALARPRPAPRTAAPRREYRAKAAFDRASSVLALIALAPLFLVVAALIRARDPGPVFFGHTRLGRNGRPFRCLKFRTMVQDADAVLERHLAANPEAAAEWEATRKLKDDPRVTRIGAILRSTSLDELPQLINIARGEMSLVGPRPIVEDETENYGSALSDYFAVRPGLTGLWQISGRSDTTYGERVHLDSAYARDVRFVTDLLILLKTVVVVLARRGSY